VGDLGSQQRRLARQDREDARREGGVNRDWGGRSVEDGYMARQHLIIAHILPVVVLTACAGGVNPHASDFVSDPEPYETWVKPNGTVIAISRNAAIPDPYQSDYISVLVATADQAEFTWYIERLGLAVEERRFTFDEGT
jgi:hypothetical protein